MGVRQLVEFRSDVNFALGNVGRDNDWYDRRINDGYLDLCGAVDYSVLDAAATIPTVAAQNFVVAPASFLAIRNVRDTTNTKNLGFVPVTEYYRRPAVAGIPTVWTVEGLNILLHPVPNGIFSLRVLYKDSPAILADEDDVTVLNSIWDVAVHYLAMHHALMNLGQELRAASFLARAISYIQSRITEADIVDGSLGLGASYPRGIEALQRRLAALQQGQV
jgi:hypothetical protein